MKVGVVYGNKFSKWNKIIKKNYTRKEQIQYNEYYMEGI